MLDKYLPQKYMTFNYLKKKYFSLQPKDYSIEKKYI